MGWDIKLFCLVNIESEIWVRSLSLCVFKRRACIRGIIVLYRL